MIKNNLLPILLILLTTSAWPLEMSGTPNELREALDPEHPSVTITGNAKKVTYSNLAHITILVTTKEDTISESLADNSDVRRRLIRDLIGAGIPKESIKNSEFSSSPHYGVFRGKKPSKYTVENSLRVTARNEDQLLSVNRAIDKADSAGLGGIEFEVENEEQLKAELRIAAIKDATTQSKAYGEALGLKLTPKSFSFNRRSSNRSERIEEVVVTGSHVGLSRNSYQDVAIPESVSFEKTEYRSSIEVIFESRPVSD